MKKRFSLFVMVLVCLALVAGTVLACTDDETTPETPVSDEPATVVKYTVRFDSLGGSAVASVEANAGSTIAAPANPTRENYSFTGWYKNAACTEIWDFSTDKVNADTTLYAGWTGEDGKILAVENATIDDTDIFMPVRHTVEYVSLANSVTIGGRGTWKLYKDILGTQEIPTKIATGDNGVLLNGDNIFYIIATSSDGQQVRTYTMTIHRSYSVPLYIKDPYGDVCATSSAYTYYEEITPNRSFTGYTVNAWTCSDPNWSANGTVMGSATFTPVCRANSYTVTLNANGGTLSGNNTKSVTYDSSYSLGVPSRTGYTFTGWTLSGEQITNANGNSFSVWIDTCDQTVVASWEVSVYTVNYDLNGGTNAAGNPSEYTILTLGSEGAIALSAPTKTRDISYTSNSNGTINVTQEVYTFEGWYLNPDFTGKAVTELTIDTGNVMLYAKWGGTSVTTTENYVRLDASDVPTDTGEYILFGSYPQTEVTDSAITTALNDMRGTLPTSSNSYDWTSYRYHVSRYVSNFMWYIDLEYSGEKYRGVYFTSYRPNFTIYPSSTSNSYQDDNGYSTGTVYWFKYEPIKWRILTESDGKAMILSELMLDNQQYDYDGSYSNNYANSTIRRWLNDTFYNTAFGALQQAIIETTEVDNSVYSTGYSSNPYACQNTFDKVFLLSYREAINSSYGFSTSWPSSPTRQKQGSDYCKAQGSRTYSNGNGYWWLRSPSDNSSVYAWFVGNVGSLNYRNFVYDTGHGGVVPALVICL